MQFMTNKGFSLLEMLITLFIITSLFVVGLNTFKEPNIEWIYFSNEYLLKQTENIENLYLWGKIFPKYEIA